MDARDLDREDLGAIPVAQRAWAGRNPLAVYREPLTMAEYLETPLFAPPLSPTRLRAGRRRRRRDRPHLAPATGPAARVRALRSLHNPDQQEGDGLTTGFAEFADDLWDAAGARPEDVDAAYLYDDYPVMVLAQALDLGLVPDGDATRWLQLDRARGGLAAQHLRRPALGRPGGRRGRHARPGRGGPPAARQGRAGAPHRRRARPRLRLRHGPLPPRRLPQRRVLERVG